jgi:Tfp pilus assembly protein PilN
MSMPPLNLASRPFRNERLPALLLALGFTAAGAITIKHAVAIRSLLPGRTSGLARQVAELENERERLRTEASHLRAPRPEPAALAQWTLLRDLVDKRTFSWSGLFALLEETLPRGVRLVSISPSFKKGEHVVEIAGVARTNEDVLELIRVLEDRPEFDGVLPLSRNTAPDQVLLEFRLAMNYAPPALPPVMATANAATAPALVVSPPAGPAPEPSAPPSASLDEPPEADAAGAAASPSPSPRPSPRPTPRRL